MFKGKIRKCLKCGGESHVDVGTAIFVGKFWVNCIKTDGHETETVYEHPYQAVNDWNRANAPAVLLPYL